MRKISPQTKKVLAHLNDGQWHYGQEIIAATGVASGTVHPILNRLHGRGHLESRREGPDEYESAGRSARRYYRVNLRRLGRSAVRD